jgi:toxin HigB-1
VFNNIQSAAARRICPDHVWRRARRRLSQLDFAKSLGDLRDPGSNRLHLLKGDRDGQHSISINMRHRVCFRWTPRGPEDVQIVDYH